jgi:hypothetical protein
VRGRSLAGFESGGIFFPRISYFSGVQEGKKKEGAERGTSEGLSGPHGELENSYANKKSFYKTQFPNMLIFKIKVFIAITPLQCSLQAKLIYMIFCKTSSKLQDQLTPLLISANHLPSTPREYKQAIHRQYLKSRAWSPSNPLVVAPSAINLSFC